MTDPSSLNRQPLQEAPLLANPGLLDQLGLPPKTVRYLRENQRKAWIITGCIVGLISAVSLYNSYAEYREGKAASALTAALKADETARTEQLGKVVDAYGSTDAGLWAKIEIAHLAIAKGDVDKGIADLQEVRKAVGKDNPLIPLLLFKLAGLLENKKDMEQALVLLDELSKFNGFEARAYSGMGRIYEHQGNKDKALEMYQKFLGLGGEDGKVPAVPTVTADPEREMIQARVSALQEK